MSDGTAPIYLDPKVAVAVIIADERGLLLQQREIEPRRGLWTFPSGYVDRGEQVERAAEREIREELGLPVTLTHLLGVYSEPGNPVLLIVFTGTIPASATPVIQEAEITAIGYFAPEALPPLAFDHDARIVADWQAFVRDGKEVLPQ
ncbi:MAG: NUDIX domain-containing protein [Chloroflexota bacterium]|nr:NUDIX domain-containing protein [Chloroflexota bacterium]